jgi:SAM-dependent methyltransferase
MLATSPRPAATTPQEQVNRRIYHAPRVTRYYHARALDCAETMALLKYQPAFAGRRVLDLGVGTGRTTRYLAPLSASYVGLDYSPHMIAHLAETMPAVRLQLGDIRNLSSFESRAFDFAVAADNVIDAVSHPERLRVLAELRRVLEDDGVFVFSSHNRRFRHAMDGPRLARARNPVTQAAHVVRYVRCRITHARVRRLRRIEPEYALLNDSGHAYATLHYYIDRETQRLQLQAHGFVLLDIFDLAGRALADGDDAVESGTLLYVAQRR